MAITRSMRRRKQTPDSTVIVDIDLPMDLIFDILSRLPVKPICKTWYALIQNPNFVKMHLANSKQNLYPTLNSVLWASGNPESNMYHIWLQSVNKNDKPNPNPNVSIEYFPSLVGICDGLVCVVGICNTITICNPTIGQVRKIPRFSLPLSKTSLDHVFLGFIFQNNGYKLFRIVYSPFRSGEIVIRGEVYTMSSNIWSEIEVKKGEIDTRVFMMDRGHSESLPVAINEVLYWGACMAYDLSCVVSFDMDRYVFDVLACPMDPISAHGVCWKLVDLKGELALTICFGSQWFDIWLLDQKERSWTMKFRTGNIPSIGRGLKSVGCERNGKLVMEHFSSNRYLKMFLYDPESHEITYLPFSGWKELQRVYLYKESLLSV